MKNATIPSGRDDRISDFGFCIFDLDPIPDLNPKSILSLNLKSERGVALVLALLALMFLTFAGLSLNFNATTDLRISQNHQSAVQAMMAAEEGLRRASRFITSSGLELTEALRINPDVPRYEPSTLSYNPGTFGYRYSLDLETARRLEIRRDLNTGADTLPAPLGTKDGRGIVSRAQLYPDLYSSDPSPIYLIRPGSFERATDAQRRDPLNGNLYTAFPVSYFAVRITDDFLASEDDNDPFSDSNNRIIVRSLGLTRSLNATGNSANSVAVVEAMLRRDISLRLDAPFLIDGPNVQASFSGNSFLFDGYNHSIRFKDQNGNPTPNLARQDIQAILNEGSGSATPNHGTADPVDDAYGIAAINPGGASNVVQDIRNAMNFQQADNAIGRPGQGGTISGPGGSQWPPPSAGDITSEITDPTSPNYNEDTTRNLLNPDLLSRLMTDLRRAADVVLPGGTNLSGNNLSLGTIDRPQVTFVDGDLSISGTGEGFGVLVVTGKFNYSGAFNFVGLMVIVGEGELVVGGANKGVIGGLLIAKLVQSGSSYSLGTPVIDIGGNSNFYYSGNALEFATSRLPLETIGFREVRTEYERNILNQSTP